MTKTKNIPPTLADAAIKQSFAKPHAVPPAIAAKIASARRFVLDAGASAFLSDLSHASYVVPADLDTMDDAAQRRAALRGMHVLDQVRELARAPHALTWIEYDAHSFRRRTSDAYVGKFRFIDAEHADGTTIAKASMEPAPTEETVPQIGWLIEEERPTQFLVTVVASSPVAGTMVLPFQYAWTTDASVPTHAKVTPADVVDSHLATGIRIFDPRAHTDKIVIRMTPGTNYPAAATSHMLVEFIGELRYVLALLAAINDVPVGVKHVEQTKGFVAKGRYRKFLSHSIISILLPKGRDPQRVARAVVAMSRRRAHQVRGHWRRNWRHEGQRIWIREHERGDASLGFVTHDYAVTHEEERS